jgi:peptide/nickel transport system ATP-binding protein
MVELAETETLFAFPKHPYSEALLSAVPRPDPNYQLHHMVLEGEVADPSSRPTGCCFHPRCKYAKEICGQEEPVLQNIAQPGGAEHFVACHFAKELTLEGVITS